jgi:hypothetical protein
VKENAAAALAELAAAKLSTISVHRPMNRADLLVFF